MPKKILQLKDIDLIYNPGKSNEFQALHDVNLEVEEGDFAVIMGPSGCGKSSLLNIIAGLELPNNGEAFVEGKDILTMNHQQRVDYHRRKMGMIFQAYNLIPTLNVLDNVALPQMFINKSKRKRDKRSLQILERLGIKNHSRKIPTELSGGQQQRIGIARAIVNDPQLILADEPVGNLDSVSSNNVMEILSRLNSNEGKTVIMVTHNPEHAVWGNRVVTMKDGKIIKIELKDRQGAVKKKQVEEGGVSEFEKLVNKFRGLSKQQIKTLMEPLKAKKIIESMVMPYDKEQMEITEDIIKKRISKRLKDQDFINKLDLPKEENGAGLDARTAERLGGDVDYLIQVARKVNTAEDSTQKASLIMDYINQTNNFSLNKSNIDKASELISQKISNKINQEELKKGLDASLEENGAGLDKRIVDKVLDDIDLLLIVGYGFE
jgi:putative ABC transport system ATP-binding protein